MGRIDDYSQYRIADIKRNLQRMGVWPLDVMVTGVTGAGKSTTLNSFFRKTVATVGEGVDSQTMEITDYRLSELFRIWDTPGLGDGVNRDVLHKREITKLLNRTYSGYKFIDLVLVIIEGSNRDMGTTYTLLNEVIIPNITPDRILVAINKADFAMKGRHWLENQDCPDEILLNYLNEQADSVQRRVLEGTGKRICRPIFYSAEYGYNIDKLLDLIIDHIPSARLAV